MERLRALLKQLQQLAGRKVGIGTVGILTIGGVVGVLGWILLQATATSLPRLTPDSTLSTTPHHHGDSTLGTPLLPGQDSSPYYKVRVFYGTDRAPVPSSSFSVDYGKERGTLSFGTTEVTIPKGHRPGHLESPRWYLLQFRNDPRRDVTLAAITSLDSLAWSTLLSEALRRSHRVQALLYIHGYNITFADAARRTAQLAYDLSFDGAAAFYSWPSHGTVPAYPADEAVTDRVVPNLVSFLQRFIRTTHVSHIHIIAHSMGARILASALQQLRPDERTHIGQVVFAAPDIDAEVFATQIVPALAPSYPHLSMYSSSKDEALKASATFHASPRAGMSGAALLVLPGLETIDASKVDTDLIGHGYFSSNKEVIDDLFMMLTRSLPAAARNLRRETRNGLAYWELP